MLKLRYYILRLLGKLPKWQDAPTPTGKIIFQDNFEDLTKWKQTIPWYTYPTEATVNNGIVTIEKGDLYIENIPPCCRIQIKLRTKNLRNYIFFTVHKWISKAVAVHGGQNSTSFKKWKTESWNIYEIELTPKSVKWYLNGLLVKVHKKWLPTHPYMLILSSGENLPGLAINAAWLWTLPPSREYDIFECYANTPLEIDFVRIHET